jgi:hypothetical protein
MWTTAALLTFSCIAGALTPQAQTMAASAKDFREYYDLDSEQEKLYDRLVAGIANVDIKIEIDRKPQTPEEIAAHTYVFAIVRRTHPEFFWLGETAQTGSTGGTAWIWPTYVLDNTEISVKIEDKKVRYPSADYMTKVRTAVENRKAALRKKLESLPVNKEMSPFEIELAVHDWLGKQVKYSNEVPDKKNMYGALVKGSANCQGITRAFQYIMGMMGIDCLYMIGDFVTASNMDGLEHAWNAVKLDGQWYHVDVTANITAAKNNGLPRYYAFFNRNDEIMATKHTVYTNHPTEINPKISCTATEYDYFRKKGLYIVSDDDFIRKMPAIITKARTNGDKVFEIEFAKDYASIDDISKKMKLIDVSYSEGVKFAFIDSFRVIIGMMENLNKLK